jgi:hypothetical protein
MHDELEKMGEEVVVAYLKKIVIQSSAASEGKHK